MKIFHPEQGIVLKVHLRVDDPLKYEGESGMPRCVWNKHKIFLNKEVVVRFRRTPGYYENQCDSYKKQESIPVQTFLYIYRRFIYMKGEWKGKKTYSGEFLI